MENLSGAHEQSVNVAIEHESKPLELGAHIGLVDYVESHLRKSIEGGLSPRVALYTGYAILEAVDRSPHQKEKDQSVEKISAFLADVALMDRGFPPDQIVTELDLAALGDLSVGEDVKNTVAISFLTKDISLSGGISDDQLAQLLSSNTFTESQEREREKKTLEQALTPEELVQAYNEHPYSGSPELNAELNAILEKRIQNASYTNAIGYYNLIVPSDDMTYVRITEIRKNVDEKLYIRAMDHLYSSQPEVLYDFLLDAKLVSDSDTDTYKDIKKKLDKIADSVCKKLIDKI